MSNTKDFVYSDAVTDSEQRFPLKDLLSLDYFKKHRHGYYRCREEGWNLPTRNYYNLLKYLAEIHEYRVDDAKTFAKAFRTGAADWRNSEATFAEIIVYRYYIRLAYEGIIQSVRLGREECDIIVDRLDKTAAYLEVFSIKPNLAEPKEGEIVVNDFKTHTQEAFASVRQKLLRKIREQHQMSKVRENYAVIEMNDVSIAGDFAVRSSLSSGYKITLDRTTLRTVAEGYDWSQSVFDDESTCNLKGIIHFDLGDYESRRYIHNPRFQTASASTSI